MNECYTDNMQVYLPVMPVEIKREVSDWNYKLNALPRMILTMLRDGRSMEEVSEVTQLSMQAVENEYKMLQEQELLSKEGSLSANALAVLDIYKFEDRNSTEHFVYYRDMLNGVLLSKKNCKVCEQPPKNAIWMEWPERYNITEDPHNIEAAGKQIFSQFPHLQEFYDLDVVPWGNSGQRRRFAPFGLREAIQPVTLLEQKSKKAVGQEEDGVPQEAESLSDTDTSGEETLQAAVLCWHMQGDWQEENRQRQSLNLYLTPWGDFWQGQTVSKETNEKPCLYTPWHLPGQDEAAAQFIKYMWNESWQGEQAPGKLASVVLKPLEKQLILCSLKLEGKPL